MRSHAIAAATFAAGITLSLGPSALDAQDVAMGSRRVATDNWSYEFIVRLRDRGYLANLNPLVQPYRAQEVARGLLELDPDTLPEPEAGWVALLREEYWREIGRLEGERDVKWGAMVAAGARASTSQRLDPLRPTGEEDVWPWLNAGAWVEAGPVVGEVRLLGDTYLSDDPDGLDPGQRRAARTDHAYVAADFPVASLIVGRLKRNWSRTHTNGLMVSDVSTAYPQLDFELRAWRFALRSFTGELDGIDGLKRYVAAHRLDYQAGDFVVSFGESILYASATGLQVRWLNPFEFLFFDHDNEPVDASQNLMLNLETWYRLGGVVLHGEAFLDDIDVDPDEGQEAEPPVYGFTLGAEFNSVAPWLQLGAEYQQVSAWAYRTPNFVDQYSFLQRGLGENYSDYDRLTLWADLYPQTRGLWVTPVLQLQRQGEGDFRDSIVGGYQGEPAIFLGVKETTYRAGLRARWQPLKYFWIAFDFGHNWVRNKDHVEGSNVTEFEAVGEIGGTIDFPLRRTR
jgi:hypothetical protein